MPRRIRHQWWFTGNGPSAGVQASYNFTDKVGLTLRVDNGLFQGPVDNNEGKAFRVDAGMTATVSSIHINGWFGQHNKLSGARWILQRLWGRQLDAEIERWVYVGDSTNDQLMFEAFPLSVGVANLRRFAAVLQTWPAWITEGERGVGFAEVARRVLATRQEIAPSPTVHPPAPR